MNFSIILERKDSVTYEFEDGQFVPSDADEWEPSLICGEILIDDKIGQFTIYELYNDTNFFERCDNFSGDLSVVANAICGKSGAILKKYLSGESEYNFVYILDRITIDKEYRNQGIGSAIIKNLLKMINYKFGEGSTIFLCASPYEIAHQYGFESDEYKKETTRLIQFYKKLGFRIVKDNVMVYNKLDVWHIVSIHLIKLKPVEP